MNGSQLHTLSAVEIASQVAVGRVTCEQIARSCIERVNLRDAVVKAWAHVDPELILRQAEELDSRSVRGPLHGVPIGVKDVIDTADMPTEMGSPIYRGYRPAADAACVASLRAAGALIFGKTVTCEFASATPAQTTNPHDPTRTPGGSSSGSAAAVADFMVPLAFGTQTGGSVQRPSSYCGIVGFKPTFGLINPVGVKPAAESLDTVGLMARTVEDIELANRALTNSTRVEWLPRDARINVGLCRTYAWDTAEDSTMQAVEDAAKRLAFFGLSVHEVKLPALFNDLPQTREIVNDYERARAMGYEWQTYRSSISEGLAKTIRNGLSMPLDRYIDGQRHVEQCRRKLDTIFDDVDVLLAPTVPGEAPLGLSWTGDHRFQSIWTQLRVPAMTLPTHCGPNGLPIGIQLVAAPYRDSHLLAISELVFRRLGRGPTIDVRAAALSSAK
jgi:Asp-tRNA(Asn)/Glu-tRNA(Gln) amidotransferase A subunit family amidase